MNRNDRNDSTYNSIRGFPYTSEKPFRPRYISPFLLSLLAIVNVQSAHSEVDIASYSGSPICTKWFRDYADGDARQMLNAAIEDASNDRCFNPPPEVVNLGPNEPQGVVRVAFDPDYPLWEGENYLLIDAPVAMASNVRLEIDSGIYIRYPNHADSALFNLTGLNNVTITRGDPSRGEGISAGRFIVDTSGYIDRGKTKMIARVMWLRDTDRFLIEHFHSIQSLRTDTAAVVFSRKNTEQSESSRNGIYRHHSNEGSPQGYGPNQITSLDNAYIHDIWTDGGTALRFETDGENPSGVSEVVADKIYGQNGNRVVVFMPWDVNSRDISVTTIRGVSMFEGIRFGLGSESKLSGISVAEGCVIGGTAAQAQVEPGYYSDSPLRQISETAVWYAPDNANPGITVSDIGYYRSEIFPFLDDDLEMPANKHLGVNSMVECFPANRQATVIGSAKLR